MDPLSDVLSLLRPRSFMSGAVDYGGDWAVEFGRHDGIKFQALTRGSCWLAIEGVDEPIRIDAGDCYLLPRGLPFRLASDLALEPVDARPSFARRCAAPRAWSTAAAAAFALGGHFAFAGRHAQMLLGMLPADRPPALGGGQGRDALVGRTPDEELREPQPGGFLHRAAARADAAGAGAAPAPEGRRGRRAWAGCSRLPIGR